MAQKILILINDAPYGTEKAYNALRLAVQLGKEHEDVEGGKVKICGSCAEARRLKSAPLTEGTEISSMAELTNWVIDSDKVVTF